MRARIPSGVFHRKIVFQKMLYFLKGNFLSSIWSLLSNRNPSSSTKVTYPSTKWKVHTVPHSWKIFVFFQRTRKFFLRSATEKNFLPLKMLWHPLKSAASGQFWRYPTAHVNSLIRSFHQTIQLVNDKEKMRHILFMLKVLYFTIWHYISSNFFDLFVLILIHIIHSV